MRIAAFLFLFLISYNINAQKTIVYGKVFDSETKEPLPFVNISFQDSKTGTVTDTNGAYYIETYYATDTIIASFMGYEANYMPIKKDIKQEINFNLSSGEMKLDEVVLIYKGNPAEKILERIIRNKPANNREKYDAYEYEVYNKVEFDLNNITEEFKNRRLFKKFQFIFDNVDSTGEKAYLPMFMTESISEYSYLRDPKSERENIIASKVSGVSSASISQFLGDMYQKVNVYENYISAFGKNFVSPIADFGLKFYKYYLVDSTYIDDLWCYKIEFKPRRIQEPVFTGYMWVNDTTYAVKEIDAQISKTMNINWIHALEVNQKFSKIENKYWMLKEDRLLIDFNVTNKTMGLYGRKFTSYSDFLINEPRDEDYYSGLETVIVAEDALEKDDDFWNKNRHDTLTTNEKNIYSMVDSLKQVPAFNNIVDLVKLVLTGYKEFGYLDFGPYFKTYSYNPVEGHRFRLGGRTGDLFSERVVINGYVAYGTFDERYKYGTWTDWLVNENPRQIIGVSYKDDLEQLGQSRNALSEDNILSSFLRRNPNNKLTNVEEYLGYVEREWFRGYSNKVIFHTRDMRPLGSLSYERADDDNNLTDVSNIQSTEVGLYTRFSYKERFVGTGFDRFSLGSDYPTVEMYVAAGLEGVLEGEFEYQKLILAFRDKIRFGTFGYLDWRIEGGKYWGTVPYPLLELHNGNESWFYDYQAFNLMNYFEFASDEYVQLMMTHHFDGKYFDRVPLFRRLKWREVVSFKTVVGRLDERHNNALSLPDDLYDLNDGPYMEASTGIENIFRLFRVDALWRLTYRENPNIRKFGVRATFEIRF